MQKLNLFQLILVAPNFLDFFAGTSVQGIALFPFIIIRDNSLKKNNVLIRHEKIHWRQQIELLVIIFYLLYILFYLKERLLGKSHQDAYRLIPFEREAYHYDSVPNYKWYKYFYRWLFFL